MVTGLWMLVQGQSILTKVSRDDFMKSSCKSPDVFPGITSMCEANTIHIVVINCETPIIVISDQMHLVFSAGSQ